MLYYQIIIYIYINENHELSGGWVYNEGPWSSVYVGEKTGRGLEWTPFTVDLLKKRSYHRSVTIENHIYHIGGINQETNIEK